MTPPYVVLVDAHRREVILAGQHKCQLAIPDQRQLLTVRPVQGVKGPTSPASARTASGKSATSTGRTYTSGVSPSGALMSKFSVMCLPFLDLDRLNNGLWH